MTDKDRKGLVAFGEAAYQTMRKFVPGVVATITVVVFERDGVVQTDGGLLVASEREFAAGARSLAGAIQRAVFNAPSVATVEKARKARNN